MTAMTSCKSSILGKLNTAMRALRWGIAFITIATILAAFWQIVYEPIPEIYDSTPFAASLGAVTLSLLNILIRKTD